MNHVIFDYFHSYLVRFCHRNEIEYLSSDNLSEESAHLLEFRKVVYKALKELVSECYIEPTIKQRSKYVVNYRTDYVGI